VKVLLVIKGLLVLPVHKVHKELLVQLVLKVHKELLALKVQKVKISGLVTLMFKYILLMLEMVQHLNMERIQLMQMILENSLILHIQIQHYMTKVFIM